MKKRSTIIFLTVIIVFIPILSISFINTCVNESNINPVGQKQKQLTEQLIYSLYHTVYEADYNAYKEKELNFGKYTIDLDIARHGLFYPYDWEMGGFTAFLDKGKIEDKLFSIASQHLLVKEDFTPKKDLWSNMSINYKYIALFKLNEKNVYETDLSILYNYDQMPGIDVEWYGYDFDGCPFIWGNSYKYSNRNNKFYYRKLTAIELMNELKGNEDYVNLAYQLGIFYGYENIDFDYLANNFKPESTPIIGFSIYAGGKDLIKLKDDPNITLVREGVV